MYRSLKKLNGYTIQAFDGERGKVKDFLFDEDSWVIRYLDVDLGTFFTEKRVLIPREQLGIPNWKNKHFPVRLTTKQIEDSPDLEFDLPVSRKYEYKLANHYEIVPYWPNDMVFYPGRESMFTSNQIIRIPKNTKNDKYIDTSLRSFSEVKGYLINSSDDNFGHIEDLIIDDYDWQIVYVIIDTKNIVPWSKQVILPIEYIEEISFPNQEVIIDLTKDAIKNAPEYDPDKIIDTEIERSLFDFYGTKIIND